jgi:hypothetical protein
VAKPVFATNDVPTATQFNSWLVNVNYAYKSATENVTSSTTLQVDDDLVVPVEANAHYHLTLNLSYGGAAAADLKVLIRTPTGGTFNGMAIGVVSSGASQQDIQTMAYVANTSEVFGILGAGPTWARVEGILITAGTAGNCQIEWAQNASSGTATNLYAGSFLSLRRLS